MKSILLLLPLIIIIVGCKEHEEYDFSTVDSQESYNMTNWSFAKKKEYYRRIGKMNQDFLSYEKCEIPTFKKFQTSLKNDLKIEVSKNDPFIIVSHFLQTDSYNHLVIFPEHKNLAFGSELFLLDSVMVAHYYSKDYKELYHKEDLIYLLNQLVFNPKSLNLDTLIAQEWNQHFFQLMVCDYHFSRERKVFNVVINKLIEDQKQGIENDESFYLRLLFNRDSPRIDTQFVKKIALIDREKILYKAFLAALNKRYPKKQVQLEKKIDLIYSSVE